LGDHHQRIGGLLVEVVEGGAGVAVDAVQAGGAAGGGDFVAGVWAKQRFGQVVAAAVTGEGCKPANKVAPAIIRFLLPGH